MDRRVLWGALALPFVLMSGQGMAATVIHAGAWETSIAGGPPRRICRRTDRTFDRATLEKMMQNARVKCGVADMKAVGATIHYSNVCDVAGGKMTMNSTWTPTGPDSFTMRTTAHLEGGQMKIPDQDITAVTRRVGPCLPTDRIAPE